MLFKLFTFFLLSGDGNCSVFCGGIFGNEDGNCVVFCGDLIRTP